jgi:hypothetical protein
LDKAEVDANGRQRENVIQHIERNAQHIMMRHELCAEKSRPPLEGWRVSALSATSFDLDAKPFCVRTLFRGGMCVSFRIDSIS